MRENFLGWGKKGHSMILWSSWVNRPVVGGPSCKRLVVS
jgi:hypothetical protein